MPSLSNEIACRISAGRPFAFVRLPEGDRFFFENPTLGPAPESGPYFRIKPWDNGEKGFGAVSRENYLASLRALLQEISPEMPKVVFSRTIQGHVELSQLASRAVELFDSFPDALAFMFFTPETGLWLGATPELLLADDGSGNLSTMALAGTRPAEKIGPWDDKNLREHTYVIDYIVDALRASGASGIEVSPTGTLHYGSIAHLHTPVSARIGSAAFSNILDTLSPTPALCGMPLEAARAAIDRHESHSRGCYGSYIEFRLPGSRARQAYVNLRCARVDADGVWTAFVGGGIVADSIPAEEWEETIRKSARIVDILARK